ncbi:bifunctional DRAP deaminase/tRNA pseudouridine synthase RIB2 SCDLUD_005065 [Saccharomycodes ludwigii]|uniref:bifunctional DRAP deaminase/tRNA pseudouridine synthase RIB2 n=1 Tax=Saccharomycodes ludwigii TaxID=36035 RepID=UPI001E862204|nr:hypothetical protein SCDLUD_005065 [Saccharomycodes ludwigii]KAH3898738.1 hypothetical protein SCDLUD_005065 [Saccharomycodes ludwigii]
MSSDLDPTVNNNKRTNSSNEIPAQSEDSSLDNKKLKTTGHNKASLRDQSGFKLRSQNADRKANKKMTEPEFEVYIAGPLRKIKPYFFEYNTFCKMRWRNRNLLDIFVSEFRDRSKEYYEKTIASGAVLINGEPANLDTLVKNGDLIQHKVHRHEPPVTSREIKIVFEDDDLVVIDKPSGVPVHPTGRYRFNTITKILERQLGIPVHPCNRLDRLTSGLMFLCKTPKGADKMREQMKSREVSKEYVARVIGEFPVDKDLTVDLPLLTIEPKLGLNGVCFSKENIDCKTAITSFTRISYDGKTSIVKCKPHTGRTHQIRVHLQYLGFPIANDPIYSNIDAWGPNLGKNGDADLGKVVQILDSVGKNRSASSWYYRDNVNGEMLKNEQCSVCETELYTDPGINDLDLWLHAYKYESTDKTKPWSYKTEFPKWALEPHKKYMELAIEEAKKCEATTTAFSVGAVLVNGDKILSTGYSRELPGNTHAEQCCIEKWNAKNKGDIPEGSVLYTTMEPCSLRLSGNKPCVDRIIDLKGKIRTVFVGVMEPDTFVKNNVSLSKLNECNIDYILVPGYEQECNKAAFKGHPGQSLV